MMFSVLSVAFVWVVAIVGIKIMKKIQPEDKIYPFYVLAICILLTLFVGWYKSWHLALLSMYELIHSI